MISSTSPAHKTDPANFSLPNTIPSGSADSFAHQMAQAIEGHPKKSRNGSQLEINFQAPQGQNSASRSQIVVTPKNAGGDVVAKVTLPTVSPANAAGSSTTPAASSSSSAAATSFLSGLLPASNAPASAAPATTTPSAPDKSQMTEDDAYWAMQPPAVQVLRNMPDDQRAAVAQGLAEQGYKIDVPIMVWGWDPLKTMELRQTYGYTWAPSMLQASIPVAPGLGVPGLPSYDPKNPPAGSIQVSTAFANGTIDGPPPSPSPGPPSNVSA